MLLTLTLQKAIKIVSMTDEQRQLIKRLTAQGIYVYCSKNTQKSCLVEIDNILIRIGSIKASPITIEETTPYIATLYVNGQKCAIVRNAGYGGVATLYMTEGDWDKEKTAIRSLDKRLNKVTPVFFLEKLCDLLIYNLLLD